MSARPIRVQLRRTKGWRMPGNTVKVDRTTRWGNPWSVGEGQVRLQDGGIMLIAPVVTAGGAVDRFRRWLKGEFGSAIGPAPHPLYDLVMCPGAAPDPADLCGKNLACWCKPGAPCHADVLLELANPSVQEPAP